MAKVIGFDLEIARPFPEDGWDRSSPLGISCAATYGFDLDDIRVYHPSLNGLSYADEMNPENVRAMIDELVEMSHRKYIVTWNGLGFDFLVLAIESQDLEYQKKVADLAMRSIDPYFNMFCDMGYGIGLQKMADALGATGKLDGMHGSLAPYMWTGNPAGVSAEELGEVDNFAVAAGSIEAQELCLDYVKQDAKATYNVYKAIMNTRNIYWKTRKGTLSKKPWTPRHLHPWTPNDGVDRLLLCDESLNTREPDTSWMDSPRSRSDLMGWVYQYGD